MRPATSSTTGGSSDMTSEDYGWLDEAYCHGIRGLVWAYFVASHGKSYIEKLKSCVKVLFWFDHRM
jgi:hypothetical protein